MNKRTLLLASAVTILMICGFGLTAFSGSTVIQKDTSRIATPEATSGQTYVLLVHGYNFDNFNGANGNCFTTCTDMYQTLVSHGYIVGLVNYYGAFSITFSNGLTYSDSSYYGTSNTPIQTIGQEIGNGMTSLFAGKNVNVDIVAYSMGGLATLYALENYNIAGMHLQNVIFLATPFDGSPMASIASCLGLTFVSGCEADQMVQGSSFLNSLDSSAGNAVANNPSTTWIVYDGNYNPWWGDVFFSGSNDGVVSDHSATYLGYNYLYTFNDLHTSSLDSFTWSGVSYFQDQSVVNQVVNNFGGSY